MCQEYEPVQMVLSDIHFARDIEKLVTQHLSAENPQLTYAE